MISREFLGANFSYFDWIAKVTDVGVRRVRWLLVQDDFVHVHYAKSRKLLELC